MGYCSLHHPYAEMSYIVEASAGSARIFTPYDKRFVSSMKRMGGSWNKEGRYWEISFRMLEQARQAMREIFGTDDLGNRELVTVTLRFQDTKGTFRGDHVMYGKVLSHATAWNSGGTAGSDVTYQESAPESGGSSKNWCSVVPKGAVVELANVPKELLRKPPEAGVFVMTVSGNVQPDRESLLRERETLMRRVADIDTALQNMAEQAKEKI